MALLLCLGARPARGDCTQEYFTYLVALPVTVAVGTTGIAAALGNGIIAGRGRRPSTAWLVFGYVAGIANLAVGFTWIGIGASSGCSNGKDVVSIGLGSANALVGGADVGLTIWGHTRPEGARLSLVPLQPAGGAGRHPQLMGLGLRLSHF